jgi:hypothetical protein
MGDFSMKLKLLIAVTILAVIGVIVIAVVKKSDRVPVTPEMTIETQVETEWDVNLDSLGEKDEKFRAEQIERQKKVERLKKENKECFDNIKRELEIRGLPDCGKRFESLSPAWHACIDSAFNVSKCRRKL